MSIFFMKTGVRQTNESLSYPNIYYRTYKNTPAVNELIKDGENGFLCEEGSEDLSRKLAVLMEDATLRARLGQQGREDMKQYAPDIIWEQWEKVLCSVIHPELQ